MNRDGVKIAWKFDRKTARRKFYKLVCLVHANMNGTVHVLPASMSLPHTQSFYDTQASDQAKDLINDADGAIEEACDFGPGANAVVMHGEIIATAGGRQYLSILRFRPGKIVIHVGDTVEWMNTDPTEPHTVTFGNPSFTPVNVTTAADGSLQSSISSTSAAVRSGILQAALEDWTGLVRSPRVLPMARASMDTSMLMVRPPAPSVWRACMYLRVRLLLDRAAGPCPALFNVG